MKKQLAVPSAPAAPKPMPQNMQTQQTVVDFNGQQFVLMPINRAKSSNAVVFQFSQSVGLWEEDSYMDEEGWTLPEGIH